MSYACHTDDIQYELRMMKQILSHTSALDISRHIKIYRYIITHRHSSKRHHGSEVRWLRIQDILCGIILFSDVDVRRSMMPQHQERPTQS